MLVTKVVFLLYALLLIVVSKMTVLAATVRRPLSRAYNNSRIFMSLMRKSEVTKSAKRSIHNSTTEVYHHTSGERDMQVFKNKKIDDAFWRLANYGPAFSAVPDDITFLKEPCDFYQSLLAGISRARSRIVFASLYLGSAKLEQDMIDALHVAMSKNVNLEITFLLDCMRGRRGGKVPTGEKPADGADPSSSSDAAPSIPALPKSSLKLLQPLVQQFPDRVRVSLYHTPDLRGMWKKVIPNTYNESIGVSHIKAYIFDDDIIISGANLSNDYFTNRQDRFCLIRNHPALTNYFHGIINVIGSFSNKLNPDGEVTLSDKDVDADVDHVKFRLYARQQVEPYLQPHTFYSTYSNTPIHRLGKHLPDMDNFLQKKTWIFPSLQMAPLYVRQDEVLTSYVLSAEHRLYLASPYLNLTQDYTKRILTSKQPVDIITAAPETNGWYKAKGLASGITTMYTYIEQKFLWSA
eukprot:Phypoly_transcript_05469.p1 GENE.Phypoly_transcript_05469~~Phypoly_transcript_05469.p1  ORF type:complete len:464 (+),score=73.81 Phypoly_transcript_05469:41-1432(+)